jgi:DNA-binding PucR family transcriptional regulator
MSYRWGSVGTGAASPRSSRRRPRAGAPFVAGLRAWLDCHGDIAAAARLTGIHPNTLSYRVKRARPLVPTDLNDPVARLELHRRLLALPTTGPR